MRYPMTANESRMDALNLKGFREVRDDELVQTEGGGWLQDAWNWFKHDVAGVPTKEEMQYRDRVAAGTRN